MADSMSDEQINRLAQKFKRDMEKLSLGVSIKAGDGPMIEVVPPPCACGHRHVSGRLGSCSSCDCETWREEQGL